jgi:uncharacterized protein
MESGNRTMSADANSPKQTPHGSPPAGGDPSMEDILASIRRILSEEEPAPPGRVPAVPSGKGDDDVLVLDPSMMVPEQARGQEHGPGHGPRAAEPALHDLRPEPDHVPETAVSPQPRQLHEPHQLHEPQPLHEPHPQQESHSWQEPHSLHEPRSSQETHSSQEPPRPLVAPSAAAATASAVGNLRRALTSRTQVHPGGATIEEMVREEIRPLLKQWLDAYLPQMVERLVQEEIERVVGRAAS